MDFLKKNYEKVLFSLVLLGLVVAVAFLPIQIGREKDKLNEMIIVLAPKPKPLPPLEMTNEAAGLKFMTAPMPVNFSEPNKLFNPMVWQKAADGHLIKVDSGNIGPHALQVTKLTPLYLKLSLDNVIVSDSGARYVIGMDREAAVNPKDRPHKQAYVSLNGKNDVFTLREVQGATADNQTNVTVVLELAGTGDRVKVSKEHPYQRIDGYAIDLKYPPETKTFPPGRRVGGVLAFNGEDYKIIDITESELVLSGSNQKKWTVKLSASPTP
jgi:hypothetical protein